MALKVSNYVVGCAGLGTSSRWMIYENLILCKSTFTRSMMRGSTAINGRQMVSYLAYAGLALLVIQFTIGMAAIVMSYFPYKFGHDFLATKSDALLHSKFYLASFYIHITSSFIGLVTGLINFFIPLLRLSTYWHKTIGKLYTLSILILACPSGLVLALTANGGVWCKVAFSLQCALWFSTTLLGLSAAKNKKWLLHVKLFIISYATTLAAFSLRSESHLLHNLTDASPVMIYQIVTWTSWVGNALLAVMLIDFGLANFLVKQAFKK
jgi:hypothetical protein